MEREMVKERERACDAAVLDMGGDANVYAEGLLKTSGSASSRRWCVWPARPELI